MDVKTIEQVRKIAFGTAMAGAFAVAIGGRVVLKQNQELIEKYNRLILVSKEMSRAASYMEQLVAKHVDGRHIDDFDQMVIDDMRKSLTNAIEEYNKLEEES